MRRGRLKKPALLALEFDHVCGFGAFRTVDYIEADRLALRQGLETLILDCRIMDKDVASLLLRNESETFRCVEPLHGPFRHARNTSSAEMEGPNSAKKTPQTGVPRVAALGQHVRNFKCYHGTESAKDQTIFDASAAKSFVFKPRPFLLTQGMRASKLYAPLH